MIAFLSCADDCNVALMDWIVLISDVYASSTTNAASLDISDMSWGVKDIRLVIPSFVFDRMCITPSF